MVLKTRVCIWDEDSESRASMLRVLNNLDAYQVTEYRAGAGGIGNLETLNPEILLLDVDYTIVDPDKLLPELRMGVTRRNALMRLANRCGIEEMRLFTAALIQAEKLGVGMAQVLEIQAENMREIRRQRAKEMAAKLPVKILFPTIIFIFPVLFVVVLGPAVVSLIDTMAKK